VFAPPSEQLVALRSPENRLDGGAAASHTYIVGECSARARSSHGSHGSPRSEHGRRDRGERRSAEAGSDAPDFDACAHGVLPWVPRKAGGGAAAVIECGALHDVQVELPILAALKREVPTPPKRSLCLPFDVPPEKMTQVTTSLLDQIHQVRPLTTTTTTISLALSPAPPASTSQARAARRSCCLLFTPPLHSSCFTPPLHR
jgi:hypothetical protein